MFLWPFHSVSTSISVLAAFLSRGRPNFSEKLAGGHYSNHIVFVFLLFFICNGVLGNIRARRDFNAARRKLTKLEMEKAQVLAGKFTPCNSCPICLEDFGPAPEPGSTDSEPLLRGE